MALCFLPKVARGSGACRSRDVSGWRQTQTTRRTPSPNVQIEGLAGTSLEKGEKA